MPLTLTNFFQHLVAPSFGGSQRLPNATFGKPKVFRVLMAIATDPDRPALFAACDILHFIHPSMVAIQIKSTTCFSRK